MRCLFVMEDSPITPDASGGLPALIFSHLELLYQANCEISLLILSQEHSANRFQRFTSEQPDVWNEVKRWLIGVHQSTMGFDSRRWSIVPHLILPTHVAYFPLRPDQQTRTNLHNFVKKINPQLIWAEHLLPATVMTYLFSDIPIVYSHADWSWRIKKHRAESKSDAWQWRLKFWQRRYQEESLVRQVFACVSASRSEADEIRALGVKNVAYLPTTYRKIDLANIAPNLHLPRIVHLGGMQTTANRLGLERFLDVSWPIICQTLSLHPELWVIGNLDGASGSLLTKLKQANAICLGFVKDLMTVLRPFDIQIIPWEHNTGTRTRIPLILNYKQVLVSTKAGAACLPELKHEQNCVLAQDLEQMAKEVALLVQDEPRRLKLAEAGRNTFERYYTQEVVQPYFNQFLRAIGF